MSDAALGPDTHAMVRASGFRRGPHDRNGKPRKKGRKVVWLHLILILGVQAVSKSTRFERNLNGGRVRLVNPSDQLSKTRTRDIKDDWLVRRKHECLPVSSLKEMPERSPNKDKKKKMKKQGKIFDDCLEAHTPIQ